MTGPCTLPLFYWVVQLGGFRRAAEELNTTQPAVSVRITGLEAQLGSRLLEWDRRSRVSLTPREIELMAYAGRMMALQAEMMGAMRGSVRLGTSETIVHTWLTALLRRVQEVHPLVTVDVSVDIGSSLRAALLAGEVDIAFLLGRVVVPGIRSAVPCEYHRARRRAC